jgi:flagellar protein FlaJ
MAGIRSGAAMATGASFAAAQAPKKKSVFFPIAEILAPRFPDLRQKLRLADMKDNPVEFLDTAVSSTVFISIALILVSFLLMKDQIPGFLSTNPVFFILSVFGPFVIIPPIVFGYLMLYPDAGIIRRQKEIDYEIVFACRHIAIALKSGMPLFDSFVGASNGYGAVSKEFAKIADKVVLGVPVAQAIRETTQDNPSKYFTRIMMQIANSLSSGADVGGSLDSVLDQISREQMISLREYSQKLTPVVMFYMVFGIIIPSLGVVLATVIFSALSGGTFGFSSFVLVLVFLMIAVIQFLFLGYIDSSRPKYLI